MREALGHWSAAYAPQSCHFTTGKDSVQCNVHDRPHEGDARASCDGLERDAGMLLARVFFAAISIYLSGVFDYELSHWRQLGMNVPILSADEIQYHVRVILQLTGIGLNKTILSPVVFLFPLRIAGARSFTAKQRSVVLHLISTASRTFASTSAISTELAEVWRNSSTSYMLAGNTDG